MRLLGETVQAAKQAAVLSEVVKRRVESLQELLATDKLLICQTSIQRDAADGKGFVSTGNRLSAEGRELDPEDSRNLWSFGYRHERRQIRRTAELLADDRAPLLAVGFVFLCLFWPISIVFSPTILHGRARQLPLPGEFSPLIVVRSVDDRCHEADLRFAVSPRNR